MAKRRGTQIPKPRCEDCFFRCHGLCALQVAEPCPTYRPDAPEGLRPPRQMRFAFRQDRDRAPWAFPTAQDQAALHAG